MTFSEKLLLLRRQKGLSQEQLAEMLDVSRQSVSKWEAQQTLPEPGKLILISEIFGVSIDQLLKDNLFIKEDITTEKDITNNEITSTIVKLDMVFCTTCGRKNRADSAFCGYCGNPFTSFIADKSKTQEMTKPDMDLAYYKANLQTQKQILQTQPQELFETQRQTEHQDRQSLRDQRQYNLMAKCPRCGSTSLANSTNDYNVGAGFWGAALFGPLGLLCGGNTSGKVKITCMKCGYKFKAQKVGKLK